MDLNALMQAAAQDPKAAAFLQQMLAGGTPMDQRMPEIAPQSLQAPKIVDMPSPASMPVFTPAKDAMDKLLGQWSPGGGGAQGGAEGGFQPQPMDVSGMPATSLGGSEMPQQDPGMIGQMQGVDPITQTTLPPQMPGDPQMPQDPNVPTGPGQGGMSLPDLLSMLEGALGGGQGTM